MKNIIPGAQVTPAQYTTAEDNIPPLPPLSKMPDGAVTGYVMHDGAKIHYTSYGRGDALLFLHGGLAFSDYWANQVKPFAKNYRVILIDSRGHGRSTSDDKQITYERMEKDIIAVLDQLGIQKASVVGWSDGGIIALVMGINHPERISGIFALAANMNPTGIKPDDAAHPRFEAYAKRSALEYTQVSPTPTKYSQFAAAVGRMWDNEPDYTASQLSSIYAPTVIAVGANDEAIEPEHSAYLARTIPNAHLVIFPNLGHFSFLQKPELVNSAIADFLKHLNLAKPST